MTVNKITTGFVIQTFDTETNEWVNQEFISDSVVVWENEEGNPLDLDSFTIQQEGSLPYLPFNMIQP